MLRRPLTTLVALLVLAGVASAQATPTTRPDKPNVVVFVVDDMGWIDWAGGGSDFYDTPNLDKLAASSLMFTDGYAACPVCSPSRAALLTGRYPQRSGITDYIDGTDQNGPNQPQNWKRQTPLLPAPYVDSLPKDETTVAEILKSAGYKTFFAGKWHLGPQGNLPQDRGFDVNIGGFNAGGPYTGNKYFSPYNNPQMENGPDGEHLPDRLATESAEFLAEHKDDGPSLVWLSFYSVHTPLMSREDLLAKYKAKRAEMGGGEGEMGEVHGHPTRVLQRHAVYAGMVEAMDQAVGKVLDEIDELGIADNTIVLFTSDNGGLSTSEGRPTSNEPLANGKGWMYEGGIRVPMLWRVPGVTAAGEKTHAVASGIDVMPTILSLVGVETEGPAVDGIDLTPALRGEEQTRGPVFWAYPHYGNQGGSPTAAVRDGDWKLIRFHETGDEELYDLSADVGEANDVAAEHADVASRLSGELDAWLKEVDAKLPTPNPAAE